MRKNKTCSLLFLLVGILFFSCIPNNTHELNAHLLNEQSKATNDNAIEKLLPYFFLTNKGCRNILMLKKNDCLSCDKILTNFMEDSTHLKNTYFINETIRKIELKDYYKKRRYLNDERMVFDSDLITKICELQNIKFSSSVIIILNEKNQVIEVGLLKELVGNVAFFDKVCKD